MRSSPLTIDTTCAPGASHLPSTIGMLVFVAAMTRLADALGIRLPSLYAHVRGQLDLRRELWMWAVADLGDRLRDSVMGRSGEDALFAFATELRDYARRHPGRYQLTLDPPVPFDEEAAAVRHRANEPFRAVIRSFGLEGPAAVHVGPEQAAASRGVPADHERHSESAVTLLRQTLRRVRLRDRQWFAVAGGMTKSSVVMSASSVIRRRNRYSAAS